MLPAKSDLSATEMEENLELVKDVLSDCPITLEELSEGKAPENYIVTKV